MTTISIEYETTPTSAKDNAELYAVWLIDDDPETPHAQFENQAEPWTVQINQNNEYMVYFHARLTGASSVKITAGDRVKSFSVPASGIVKKMFYLLDV